MTILAVVLAWLTLGAAAIAAAPPPDNAVVSAPQAESRPAAAEREAGSAHGGLLPQIAKVVNFAVLVGVLWHFLRKPIAGYLAGRSDAIRKDLVDAANVKSAAEQQLNAVREQLSSLPAELEALRRRGEEELAGERVRMKEATAKQREQLLERTRREIDVQFRIARRQLLEHTANVAMKLARARIERTITPDDQTRLIDRYTAEVHL